MRRVASVTAPNGLAVIATVAMEVPGLEDTHCVSSSRGGSSTTIRRIGGHPTQKRSKGSVKPQAFEKRPSSRSGQKRRGTDVPKNWEVSSQEQALRKNSASGRSRIFHHCGIGRTRTLVSDRSLCRGVCVPFRPRISNYPTRARKRKGPPRFPGPESGWLLLLSPVNSPSASIASNLIQKVEHFAVSLG